MGRLFTATEAAGVGALAGMCIAIAKGLRYKELVDCIIDAGKTSAPIMILLITAGCTKGFLSLADIDSLIIGAMTSAGLDGAMGLVVMVIIWLTGNVIRFDLIILLTVPLFMTLRVEWTHMLLHIWYFSH
ncbi:MAG: hypothetical protein CM15mP117_24550 [Alphaproteobacteria bacterium]|nr:MAG: hypothetical protein CM15mP117_24550 [Alphaproteobacteria bacterium]